MLAAGGTHADVATACGYVDQAHFIHEFRELGGLTPGQYIATPSAGIHHVAAPDLS